MLIHNYSLMSNIPVQPPVEYEPMLLRSYQEHRTLAEHGMGNVMHFLGYEAVGESGYMIDPALHGAKTGQLNLLGSLTLSAVGHFTLGPELVSLIRNKQKLPWATQEAGASVANSTHDANIHYLALLITANSPILSGGLRDT